ncbi:MAG: response regulator transcription factor [Kiritimatiellia bacterium]|nr:response regulator transcription factor [Kiritimatiellia bacterium]
MKPITVLLADDHSLVRLGLSALLAKQGDMKLVGAATNGEEAIRLAARFDPDVIIMDLMMPIVDGVTATRRIRERNPDMKVLILTSFGTSSDVAHAIEAGARGAILKDAPNASLLAAIRTIAAGGESFADDIVRNITRDPTPRELTARQAEILKSVTNGLTNKTIAQQLKISPESVKQHLNAIFQKLGATTRAEAVAIALRKHLLKI